MMRHLLYTALCFAWRQARIGSVAGTVRVAGDGHLEIYGTVFVTIGGAASNGVTVRIGD